MTQIRTRNNVDSYIGRVERYLTIANFHSRTSFESTTLVRMTATERELLEALSQLEATVKTMASANPKPNLRPMFERIDSLTAELPRGTDPSLLHYLHKKSYEKARLFLEGRDAENAPGNCGHV